MATPPKVEDLTYEQARDELAQIVERLEGGSATLEESLDLWERGEALARRCLELVEGARERVAQVRGDHDEDDPADTATADTPTEDQE